MKIEYQDKIDDYMNNRMSDAERTEFEKDIQNNHELKEQLQFTEDLRKVLKSRNSILRSIESWENERLNKAKKSPVKHIYYWTSGIAALFIVGLFTFSIYISPYLKGLRTTDTIADNTSIKTKNEYEIIETLMANCDYEKALELLEKKQLELQWDLGMYALDSASDGIIDSDENVTIPDNSNANNDSIRNKNESEYEYILWLKAQALIALNRKDDASFVLWWLQIYGKKYDAQADSLYNLIYK